MLQTIAEEDHRLNVVYKKLMAAIPTAAQREKLKVSQRAWLDWMSKEEDAIREIQGNKTALASQIDIISSRTRQLEDMLSQRENFYGRPNR
jgi:uncharacterized protein YecT (DUF1311 family)